MKGQQLEANTIVILSLDGTRVFVEDVTQFYAAVVALPEQPTERADERVFTPGKVGVKKISPLSGVDKTEKFEELSKRNQDFIMGYEAARTAHGNNYIFDDVLRAAAATTANAPDPKAQKEAAKAAKAAERDARKAEKAARKGGPKLLERCEQCGEQRGHPSHPSGHEYVGPPPPVVPCLACDKPESEHAENALGHRFVGGKMPKPAREAKAPREPRPAREPKERTSRGSKPALPTGKHRWVVDATRLQILQSANGKYNEGNSGWAVIEIIRAGGDTGVAPEDVIGRPRCPSTFERTQLAFQQLLGAGLLEVVV